MHPPAISDHEGTVVADDPGIQNFKQRIPFDDDHAVWRTLETGRADAQRTDTGHGDRSPVGQGQRAARAQRADDRAADTSTDAVEGEDAGALTRCAADVELVREV